MTLSDELITLLGPEVIRDLENLVLIWQAIGGVILAYLIFSLINTWINRKKRKELEKMNENLIDIKKLLVKQNKMLIKKSKK
jgi:phosphate/sulfate permease